MKNVRIGKLRRIQENISRSLIAQILNIHGNCQYPPHCIAMLEQRDARIAVILGPSENAVWSDTRGIKFLKVSMRRMLAKQDWFTSNRRRRKNSR